MATYVNDLRLKEIATGDESGTWGASTNTNLELIAEAFSFGTEAITTNADTHTTTIADGSTDPGRSIYLKYTGTLDSACTITIGPNTVSKLWFIENGTSGSQNIIISQGSGANVTIPAGHVKAVYSDGAGSGAAMVDAFTNLNLGGTTTVDDLTISDDLTVTDDMTVGGTLGVTGVVTANAGVVVDNITIDGTEIDLSSGDLTIDVAGDIILDADGGNVTFKDGGTAIGDLVNSSSDFVIESKVQDKDIIFKGDDGGSGITALTLDMSAAGAATFNSTVTATGTSVFASLDISGDIDVDGTTNLDVVDIDGAVDMASTLQVDGAITSSSAATITTADNNPQMTLVSTDADANVGPVLKLYRNSSSPADDDLLGRIQFTGEDDAGNENTFARINVIATDVSNGSEDARMEFAPAVADDFTPTMSLTSGNVGIGTTSPTSLLHLSASSYPKITLNDETGVDRAFSVGTSNETFTIRNETGSTDSFVIDNSNNVGIGTASPDYALHVTGSGDTVIAATAGASSIAGLNLGNSTNKADGGIRYDNSSDALIFRASNAEKMRIDSSGKVGIGTTSPSGVLHVTGSGNELYLERSSHDIMALGIGTVNSQKGLHITNATDTVVPVSLHENAPAATLVIDASGNLGIGTTPDRELHLKGATPRFRIEDSDGGYSEISGSGAHLTLSADGGDSQDSSRMAFEVDGTERARILSGGHFLMGTTTNQGVGGISFQETATGVNIQQNMDGTSGGAELYVFRRNSTQIGSINQSSTNAVTYNTSSDARLKDVTGSSRGLDVINNLNPVAYNWKADNHADEGLIAQEVEELVPNAVNQDEDGYYSMDYSKLVTHLVKGMQEQQEQIELLKSEIANLKEK
jgi:hypothetical protein